MLKKRILITGGAGFIGGHLAESLLKDSHTVAVIDDLSTGSMKNVEGVIGHPHFSYAIADIRNDTVLDRMMSQADIVMHLAAAVGVKLIVDRPVYTIETNVMGTETVLKTALRYKCRTLIVSTSEVYGKGIKTPFSEGDDVILGTTDKSRWAYAASKMVDEFLAQAYLRQYGLPITLVRLFNTVGPRQSGQYGMVLPTFVRQALENKDITVYGDGKQQRCFCDVSDVIVALKGLVMTDESIGKLYNIGSQEEISIMELAERIKKLTRSKSKIVTTPYSEAYGPGFEDMARRIPDLKRINQLLGWKPAIKLDQIIKGIADSMKNRKVN